jgi:hypothetical protein
MAQGYVSENLTSPDDAPPRQVALRLPVGHTARAARTQPSHCSFEMLMEAPDWVVRRENFAEPLTPSVRDADGLPLQPWMSGPAIPPQMDS